MNQRHGILLLLKWDGIQEPKYYKTKWKQETERDIDQASREARIKHGVLMLRNPFGGHGGSTQSGDTDIADAGASGLPRGRGQGSGDNAGSGSADSFYAAPPPPPEEKK
jgi:hypothetical protein